jgi:hypothetical protein
MALIRRTTLASIAAICAGLAFASPASAGLSLSGVAYYSDDPAFTNSMHIAAPQSVDAMTSSSLQSKAMLFMQDGKLSAKLSKGDFVALTSDPVCVMGVGSEMRFDPDNWVDFLGAKYRKGGFNVTSGGLQFNEATEKYEGDKALVYHGGQWLQP